LTDVAAAVFEVLFGRAPAVVRDAPGRVTENARVLAARDALRRGEEAAFGALMNASHRSMRDDFEVSASDVDALVAIAQLQRGVFGARMTGRGFGGAVVLMVRRGGAHEVAEAVAERYARERRRTPSILIP